MSFSRIHILYLAVEVQRLALKYYEPGNQKRSYKSIWRNHVWSRHHISYRTFLKYISIKAEKELREMGVDTENNLNQIKIK